MDTPNVEAGDQPTATQQTGQIDTSQGFPVPADQSVQAPAQPAPGQAVPDDQLPAEAAVSHVETSKAPEGTIATPEELQAAANRLKQQNAQQAKLLASIGLDPLSDLGEQLESGLVTPEMVRQHVAGLNQPLQQPGQVQGQQPAQGPVDIAQSAYDAAVAACETEGQESGNVSFQTMKEYNQAVIALQDAKANAVSQELAASRQADQANANVDRVLSVARSGDYYNRFSEEAKQASDFAHVALTRAIAEQECQRLNMDMNRLTPQQYEYFAQKATSQLGILAQSVASSGQPPVPLQSMPVNPNNFVPNPASGGGGTVQPVNPFAGTTQLNHKDAARQYVHSLGQA